MLPNWYSSGRSFGVEELTLSLGEDRTAVMSGRTITYELDFNTETYEVLRHYTLEDFDNLVTYNERWEIFNANRGRFEGGWWGEVVAHDKQTGEFIFFHDRYAYSAVFGGDDLLLISEVWGLKLFDMNTMRIILDMLPMPESDYEWLDRVISGVAFDSEREWFIVAWLSLAEMDKHPYEYSTNVMISTYTTSGELLRTIDTGIEMRLFPRMYSILELELVLDGEGNVLFRDWSEWDETDVDFEGARYWD